MSLPVVPLVFAGLALILIGVLVYPLARKSRASRSSGLDPATETARKADGRTAVLGGAILAIVLIGAGITYSALGYPGLAGASRDSNAGGASSAEALEKQLQKDPNAAGYKRLANMYFAAAKYDKAVAADHRAIEMGATDAGTWSEFGESIVMANDGQVAPQALAAFTNAIDRDPSDARARFYIGMAEAQIGNLRQAVAIWRDLTKDADPKAKWLPMVRQHIDAFSKEGGFDPQSVTPAAPSPDAMRQAVRSMAGALNPVGPASPPADMPSSARTPGRK